MSRITVTADTHCRKRDGSDLPEALLDACAASDLVVHLGDLGSAGVLDRLEKAAPLVAVRGRADRRIRDARIDANARVIERDGLRIGVINELSSLEVDIATFGGAVDAVLYGNTHELRVSAVSGVLFVNPGSPTLPAPKGAAPSFVLLELESGIISVEARTV